jgi:uncharacterized protein (TIGR01777 family)
MRYLIAGGTGLIGSALAESLLADGHKVSIISRNPSIVNPELRAVSWDESALLEELVTADAVVNLAGASLAGENPLQMRWTPQRKQAIISSRLAVGKKLVDAISQLGRKPEVFVQASAIGFYGNQGSDPADENSSPGHDFLAQVCREWETATADLEKIGVRRLVIRIGLVLSQRGGLLPLLALPFRLLVGGKIGTGNQYLSWIHIQDIVKSIQFLIDDPRHQGVYNLTAPNPETNQAFSQLMGNSLRRPVWLPIPSWVLKIALGEASTLALDGRPVYPTRLLKSGYQFQFPDLKGCLESML